MNIYTIGIIPLCKHSEWHASVALFLRISLEHILDKHTLSLPPKIFSILSILSIYLSIYPLLTSISYPACSFFVNHHNEKLKKRSKLNIPHLLLSEKKQKLHFL